MSGSSSSSSSSSKKAAAAPPRSGTASRSSAAAAATSKAPTPATPASPLTSCRLVESGAAAGAGGGDGRGGVSRSGERGGGGSGSKRLLEEQVEERGAVGKDETKRVKTMTQAVKPPTAAAVREDAGSGVGVAGRYPHQRLSGVEASAAAAASSSSAAAAAFSSASSSLKSTEAVGRGAATHTQTCHGAPIKKEGLHQSSKPEPHFRRRESWTATSWCSVWRAQQDVERGERERGVVLQDCEIAAVVADCITQIVLTVSSNVSLAAPR